MDNPHSAVVIEDEPDIRELIGVVLSQAGFDVHSAEHGATGVEMVRRYNPAVVTLDLGLPDIDGLEVARRIRLFSDSYIIMLTARADELNTLLGLETGADDYLTKPFRPRELRARVRAMLRRPRHNAEPGHAETGAASGDGSVRTARTVTAATAVRDLPGTLVSGGLLLNGASRIAEVDGTEVPLTRTEFDLLLALMESGRRVRTKAELVRRLRGGSCEAGGGINDSDERTIEVHVANLRRKLGDDPRSPRWIRTVRGVGYQLLD
ncbi:response regulator transcription factor [Specibacter sp. RAF43]|uniref:response regulator transcription factor n=1 Tax=Specibacter sp. RAF43 TaxID=3233057 RepID=UPI003F945EAD